MPSSLSCTKAGSRDDCRAAMQRAARWALSCRNRRWRVRAFPRIGLGCRCQLLSGRHAGDGWISEAGRSAARRSASVVVGPPHAVVEKSAAPAAAVALKLPAWTGSVASLRTERGWPPRCADNAARVFDAASGKELSRLQRAPQRGLLRAIQPRCAGTSRLAVMIMTAIIWDAGEAKVEHRLDGSRRCRHERRIQP